MALTEEGIISVPGVLSRWVRLANGARAHYVTAGETGPAVVLLHGGIAGSSGTAGWRFMIPYLAINGFRVYAPDQPGFGLADSRPEYWPTQGGLSLVEFLHDFVNALCLDQFHLGGNSMGATVVGHYVVDHPERVLSFILIATNFLPELGLDPDGSVAQRLGGITIPPWDGTPEGMGHLMDLIIYRKEAVSEDLMQMRTLAGNRQAQAFAAYQQGRRAIMNDPNLRQKWMLAGRLDKVTVPGIYLYGQNDVLVPVEAGYMQEDVLPNIRFYYPGETGHQGQTDSPDLFNAVFAEFFQRGVLSPELERRAGVSTRRQATQSLAAATGD
jgi:pimeloyl-ACP methyl ester carboxylesterase